VFSPENQLLTANGKLRRESINARYASDITAMYDSKGSREAADRQHT
jgi:long-subunit acyl-CoA synthetase (AMP-forming)